MKRQASVEIEATWPQPNLEPRQRRPLLLLLTIATLINLITQRADSLPSGPSFSSTVTDAVRYPRKSQELRSSTASRAAASVVKLAQQRPLPPPRPFDHQDAKKSIRSLTHKQRKN